MNVQSLWARTAEVGYAEVGYAAREHAAAGLSRAAGSPGVPPHRRTGRGRASLDRRPADHVRPCAKAAP
ncbi:hypothetical protein [Saccharothrix algeriensis]|uniref:Uncharacterized protein n=1 Tax=Saccharothrix algeriensis TaxID=173560 RepID=A0A8T8HW40_9PSEU|nr:hypothetical protein [Saccharothrix algeriensis]MBM7814507.1 hypothetical protein [Saccharothrix algeriensis]QTR02805.1 hypothetical protein J7S33_27880 [Saccharothrix algeriensis]